ncbi:rhodanese-like domain-containing protein [candidate division WWE3 bacterium]|uniref:Rhodanese-like domain-containing protein n=1 Tax=candidate division WWE3 bacterium TaxID=2053526 RepID=A0A955ECN7_UNCKA|nr:rhodanese-like domain-containing protein [candidate division WWE3 bacterium]
MRWFSNKIFISSFIGFLAGSVVTTLALLMFLSNYIPELRPLFASGHFNPISKPAYNPSEQKPESHLIADYYAASVATLVSPHGLRKDIMQGKKTFVLVDLRSEEEYLEEHVVGAVNIPAYRDRDHSAYDQVDRIVTQFRTLLAENPDKEVIVYCYSMPCMTGRKIGNMLAQHGIYVKELGVGWNEWRYHWELWNHPHEWSTTDVMDYISTGKDAGVFKGEVPLDQLSPCSIDDTLGC